MADSKIGIRPRDFDFAYVGIAWKDGGRTRDGLDCAGLAAFWLKEQMGIEVGDFSSPIQESYFENGESADCRRTGLDNRLLDYFSTVSESARGPLSRGDIVFFRQKATGKVCHVAVYLGNNHYLHTLCGLESRINTGTQLLERIGFSVAGVVSPKDVGRLGLALRDPNLGDAVSALLIIVSIALSAASSFLLRPKLGQMRNQNGRYGFDQLFTQTSSELPLADVLGCVTMAGNSPFQSLIDKSQTVGLTDTTGQKVNKVVILGSGPVSGYDATGILTKINGLQINNPFFYATSPDRGLQLNPNQAKDEAVDGTIGADTNRSSVTYYTGAHDVSVPVDVRAQYDRAFPVYGFSGCAYMVFRLINSVRFPSFNLTTNISSRLCRQFDATGFTVTTVTGESLTGANGSKVRFKLANWDIKDVSSLTVNGTSYNPISPAAQTGNVYSPNQLKGYVEFMTAPPSSATISITYRYYPRAFTQNPVSHLVYLLTEPGRGKGFDESKIDWPRADSFQTYCDQTVTWSSSSGTFTGPRYTCNYAIDFRKPIQEHIRAVLDSCYGYLFISGGKFVLKARKAESAVQDFDSSGILEGSFSSDKIDRTQRCNRINVFYHSAETLNAETGIVRDDVADQQARANRAGDNGVVEETLKVLSIDNQAQAERFGEQILREEAGTRWTCEFKTNIRGLALEPGDVITVTHPSQPPWQQKLFRIEELNYDENDRLALKCSEYFDGAYI